MPELSVVTGATGNVGREVVRELLARGERVRAAVTDEDSARTELGQDVEVARLVFGDPATYAGAFQGATRLFLMRPPQIADVARRIVPAVNAAAWAGVRHVTFLSLQGAEKNPVVPHRRIERHLETLGVPYTLLRPSFFMQNLSTTHAADLRDRDRIVVPAGGGRTSFVDVRDIAAVAALTLTEDGHAGRAYELTGSDALTYSQVADILTRVLGRRIEYTNPTPVQYWRHARAQGHPPGFVLVTEALYAACRFGLAARVTDDTRRLLGRAPISFEQFARDYAHVWTRAET